MKKGKLKVITGSMYGGKSLELIEEIKSWQYRDISYMAFSPIKEKITSRGSNIEIDAIHVGSELPGVISYMVGVSSKAGSKIQAVAIDEVSFYDKGIVQAVSILLDEGIDVVVAGLDQDFRGLPFGAIGDLMAIANDVRKRYSVCMKCKSELANRTQRLLNGEPAPFAGQLILVDQSSEHYTYECRCSVCHERG